MTKLTDKNGMDLLAMKVIEAKSRGYDRGHADALYGFKNEAPLSGEWAGESIPELLGDLIENDDDYEIMCDAYETGYLDAQEMIAISRSQMAEM